MNENIIKVLSKVPKEILIHCAEFIMSKKSEETYLPESTRVCVKVANLRKLYGSDATLEKWLEDSSNVYCGRSGRIFIDKQIFHYSGSKWANPYPLKKYTPEECTRLFREHITKKIAENPEYYDLDELRGKNLGCWCSPKDICHVDTLLSLI
jgi:hypothetical protein